MDDKEKLILLYELGKKMGLFDDLLKSDMYAQLGSTQSSEAVLEYQKSLVDEAYQDYLNYKHWRSKWQRKRHSQ